MIARRDIGLAPGHGTAGWPGGTGWALLVAGEHGLGRQEVLVLAEKWCRHRVVCRRVAPEASALDGTHVRVSVTGHRIGGHRRGQLRELLVGQDEVTRRGVLV